MRTRNAQGATIRRTGTRLMVSVLLLAMLAWMIGFPAWASGAGSGNSQFGFINGLPTGEMKPLLSDVSIETQQGETVKDGQLFVGEKYKITLTFSEGGAQSINQFSWDDGDGTMTYQLPANFKVDPKENISLTIQIDGEPVTIGTYSVTADGELVVTLNENGKKALNDANNASLNFEMDATVEAGEGGDDVHFNFDDAGQHFGFDVVDQARVEVDKQGKYTENADRKGGQLEYTVSATVKRGSVHDLSILDELTPPNTSALKVEDVNLDAIKVKLKRLGADGKVTDIELTKDTDYELVEVPDTEHPGKKTFQVKLKEESKYYTLNEGDVLEVTYPYEVEYVEGATDVFWGNVANDVNVTGKGKVPAPADDPDKETPEIDIDEHRGSNVEIMVTPPGDGVIYKTQEFSEAEHKLHYTLYTLVPKGDWTPFYIQDDMVVEFGGKKYYLPEFQEGGRVSGLKVSTVDVNDGAFSDWKNATGDQRQQSLEALKKSAKDLGAGFNFDVFPDEPYDPENPDKNKLPDGYNPESMEQWVYMYVSSGNRLDIIFGFSGGKHRDEYEGKWGHWNITEHDTLIITEYDLDMSNDKGPITLNKMSDGTELKKEASEVLLAGITNNVNMRYSGYYPGYSVFFNNSDRMNKTGTPIKEDNTIEFTVTMNTTDTTVNKYFRDVKSDLDTNNNGWSGDWYSYTMQAVFYDKLPEGWEYVPDTLTAIAQDQWGNVQIIPYNTERFKTPPITDDGRVISAPLVYFYNNDGTGTNKQNHELYNTFGETLTSLTFTYKLKATDEWIRDHATATESVLVHNYADIRDNLHPQAHWDAETNVPYLPQHLSKTAQQVGDSNLLRFTLHVNPGNVTLDSENGYLVVTDTSTNLEIQTSSIKVTDVAGNELKQVNYKEGMTLGDDQWALMPETESGQFKLMVPDGKALLVTYNALIPELGTGISVSNTAGIEGVVNSDSVFDRTINVDHIAASGEGNTYTLNFEKVDSIDSRKKLPGAQFNFYLVLDNTEDDSESESQLKPTGTVKVGGKEYSCYSEEAWTFTTEANNGHYQIPSSWKLEPGNYYILEETVPPVGYEKLAEPVLFYFGAKNDVDNTNYPGATFALPGGKLTVSDPPIQYKLPESGGSGTVVYVALGVVLVVGSAALLIAKKRLHRAR